ncbi:response regulator [Massilia endophytica]|uniref:response regulator n=1 Tax=Massilia endophytica TaxID=2899220 RepID=UPI001E63122E|nr:response regulator [Massilia endophytica]UGQ47987.1 response regulator [Massilia endophytica]
MFFDKQKLEQSRAPELPAGDRYTIMIIDDKDANLAVMTAVLRPHYHLVEARDGQEALTILERMAEREQLACIISDQRMPGLSGVELLEKVHALLPHTTRIIVSGYIDVDAVVDSINKAEIHRFIAKPFDAHEFLSAVRRAVTQFERQRTATVEHAAREQEVQQLSAALRAAEARIAQLEGSASPSRPSS